MQVRQVYEIIIFPKVFTILNFYSKGLYSLQISLTAEDQQKGTFVKGFPFLVEGPDAVKSQQKKAKVILKQNKVHYTSQNFYVTFSSETFYFHTMPYFKIELQKQKKYKIWIQFNLILTSYKIAKKYQQKSKQTSKNKNYLSLGEIDQKITVVDSKRLFLNNISQLNTYERVLFSEPDYFSYTDAYIYSIRTETVIRPYSFSMYEFQMASIQQRSKFQLVKSQELKSLGRSLQSGISVQLQSLLNQDICSFYRRMIYQPIKQYKKLAHIIQHFRAMMMTLNNSTIIDDINIPYLQNIGKSFLRQDFQKNPTNIQNKSLIHQYYQTQSSVEVYLQIIHESLCISKNKRWLFSHLCSLLIKINYNIFQLLSEPVIQQKEQLKQTKFLHYGDIIKEKTLKHNQFVNFRKKYCQTQSIIHDGDIKHPFVMLQDFDPQEGQHSSNKKGIPSYVVDNLVVFVHGYQGSDFDLEIAKYNLEMYTTHSYCLMSASIQDQMDESIEYLGMQLATEIKQHVVHSYNSYKRINFVGYSLGGIVIRQAMRHLVEYKQKMNLFISLASPHTGTIDGGNFLIKTGIWYLINFQNAKNIKQLHCQFQGKQQQNFILKKLSQCESLEWFKKFVVVSSQQDSFVPYCSSRIDQIASSTITKLMCENIKKRIQKLERVEVWFDVDHDASTMDKILGRKAHIQFLENKVFLRLLFKIYSSQF